MTETITGRRAYELLEAVVAEVGPDYVDPNAVNGDGCAYVETRNKKLVGSCGVGRALIRAGLPPERLRTSEGASHLDAELAEVTADAALVFEAFQDEQDDESTFGNALYAAKYRLDWIEASRSETP